LQGIKKGVIELADGVVINKAEGDYAQKAQQTKVAYQNALHLLSQNIPDIITKVLTASALNNIGISDVWDEITNYIRIVRNNGYFEKRRKKQLLDWFNSLLNEALMNKILNNQIVKQNIQNAEKEISELKMSPVFAVERIMIKI
jgi:LAO/AO transport system kinase